MKRFALLSLLIIPLSVIAAKRAEAPAPLDATVNRLAVLGFMDGVTATFTGDISAGGELAVGQSAYFANNITVGQDVSAHSSAILELISDRKGLLLTRLTRAQRMAIPNPADGLMVYQTDQASGFYGRDAGVWKRLVTSPQ